MLTMIDTSLNNKHFLHAYTLADMNELLLDMIRDEGKNVKIKVGSKEVMTRELCFVNSLIEFPQNKSIATRTKWTNEYALNEYSKEITTDIVPPGFNYSYGNLIRKPVDQVEKVIEILREDRNSRQAIITIADRDWLGKDEPPCCRYADFKIRDGELNLYLAFRSHDATAYFPNIWAFAELQRLVAKEIGVQTGKLGVHSESLHLYEGDANLIGWSNL